MTQSNTPENTTSKLEAQNQNAREGSALTLAEVLALEAT
jgi:hypothetical protein